MKKTISLLFAAAFCVLVVSCSSTTDKTEPAKSEPAAAEPATPAPPPVEQPVPEPPRPAEPSKAETTKAEPVKAAPAKNEPAKSEAAKSAAAKNEPAKNEPKAAAPKTKETTLSSGIKMIDSKEGQGDAVKTGNTISVHYTGWLYENGKRGSKFDSSVDRGPFNFTVGSGVIKGWSEGVVGMKPGGKRELIIPPDLAYGPGGAGNGIIPPNATLDFEIELLQILR